MTSIRPASQLFRLLTGTHKSNIARTACIGCRTITVSAVTRRRKDGGMYKSHSKLKDIRAKRNTHSSSFAWQPECNTAVESVTLATDRKRCYVLWSDGLQADFHSSWLRHNCHCVECRHPNGQKLLNPISLSCSLNIHSVAIKGESLTVEWSGTDGIHRGELPLAFLRAHNYNKETINERSLSVKCQKALEIPTINYEDIINSKESYLTLLQQVNEEGISIIKGVPCQENMVQKVAEMIGPVMPTIYGSTFVVEVMPDPINVAYSSLGIDIHQDLVYFESPPGLQLLHCLEFDECVEGGGSMFLDILDVVDKFRVTYPELFHTLTTVPATFQKVHYDRDYPTHIVNQKPHIKLNHRQEVVAVYWAPPFEGPLAVCGDDVEKYYLAYGMFAKMLKDSPKMTHRLKPGELVIFNNLRMLHGREAFATNGGARRLMGCYLNIDLFKSHTQVLNNLIGDGRLAKRVCNQCWF